MQKAPVVGKPSADKLSVARETLEDFEAQDDFATAAATTLRCYSRVAKKVCAREDTWESSSGCLCHSASLSTMEPMSSGEFSWSLPLSMTSMTGMEERNAPPPTQKIAISQDWSELATSEITEKSQELKDPVSSEIVEIAQEQNEPSPADICEIRHVQSEPPRPEIRELSHMEEGNEQPVLAPIIRSKRRGKTTPLSRDCSELASSETSEVSQLRHDSSSSQIGEIEKTWDPLEFSEMRHVRSEPPLSMIRAQSRAEELNGQPVLAPLIRSKRRGKTTPVSSLAASASTITNEGRREGSRMPLSKESLAVLSSQKCEQEECGHHKTHDRHQFDLPNERSRYRAGRWALMDLNPEVSALRPLKFPSSLRPRKSFEALGNEGRSHSKSMIQKSREEHGLMGHSRSLPSLNKNDRDVSLSKGKSGSGHVSEDFSIGDKVIAAKGLDARGPLAAMGIGTVMAQGEAKGFLVVQLENGEDFLVKSSALSKLGSDTSSPRNLSSSAMTVQRRSSKIDYLRIGDQVLVSRVQCIGEVTPAYAFEGDGGEATVVDISKMAHGKVQIKYPNAQLMREVRLEHLMKVTPLSKQVKRGV